MAARFISAADPTGEKALKYWVARGDIKDILYISVRVHNRIPTLDFTYVKPNVKSFVGGGLALASPPPKV